MPAAQPIVYWDRSRRRLETEKVYGDALVQWIYGTGPGRLLSESVLSHAIPSRAYGRWQSSPLSRWKIRGFVSAFDIPMQEYEVPPGGFRSFNDFFIRRFKPGMRLFSRDPGTMPAFAEARYLAFEAIREEQVFPVKGLGLDARRLLGDGAKAAPFIGGPLLLARLCPVDYHRFHFPDSGKISEAYRIHGKLHSVNPVALRSVEGVFVGNERQVTLLETEHFGRLAYVEVGALCVGRIVQSGGLAGEFQRGEEKGYFLFGGSTVIVVGEPGRWRPEPDLLEQTSKGIETLVRLGEPVATAGRRAI